MTDCKHIDTMVEKILERPNYEHAVDCDVCASSIPATVSTALNSDFTQQYLPIAQSPRALETFQDSVEKSMALTSPQCFTGSRTRVWLWGQYGAWPITSQGL